MKLGCLNVGPAKLLRIQNGDEPKNMEEELPDAQFFVVHVVDDHFVDIIQFLSTGTTPEVYSTKQKKQLVVQATSFFVII